MTQYGRGGRKATKLHLHSEDKNNRSGSLCGSAGWWQCVPSGDAHIVKCEKCLKIKTGKK